MNDSAPTTTRLNRMSLSFLPPHHWEDISRKRLGFWALSWKSPIPNGAWVSRDQRGRRWWEVEKIIVWRSGKKMLVIYKNISITHDLKTAESRSIWLRAAVLVSTWPRPADPLHEEEGMSALSHVFPSRSVTAESFASLASASFRTDHIIDKLPLRNR